MAVFGPGSARPLPNLRQVFGDDAQDAGVWRDEPLLVKELDATLPERCIKCNAASTRVLERRVSWHPPQYFLALLLGLIGYAIVALIVTRKAYVAVPLCDACVARRRRVLLIAWSMGLAGLALLIWLASGGKGAPGPGVAYLCVGLTLAGPIYASLAGRLVQARRIDATFVWISGASATYLKTLPSWPHAQ